MLWKAEWLLHETMWAMQAVESTWRLCASWSASCRRRGRPTATEDEPGTCPEGSRCPRRGWGSARRAGGAVDGQRGVQASDASGGTDRQALRGHHLAILGCVGEVADRGWRRIPGGLGDRQGPRRRLRATALVLDGTDRRASPSGVGRGVRGCEPRVASLGRIPIEREGDGR